MKKLFFLLVLPLVLSFQNGGHSKTTRLFNDNLEVLNGNVKQLIETEHNHTAESEFPLSFITNTNFDNRGNIVSERKMQTWEKKWRLIKYTYKYDALGRNTTAIVNSAGKSISEYKYGKDGHIN